MSRTTSPEDVIDFLHSSLDGVMPMHVSADTSLLSSGMVDSLALFRLLEWIESRLGATVDVLSLNLPDDWDTPRAISDFVARRR